MSIEIIDRAPDAAIAEWVAERLLVALDKAGPHGIAICLPGGSTPFPILAELIGREIDWTRVTVWPGDDRMVEESHPASNVGRVRGLLEPAGATVTALREGATPPHFALVWLGMGGDGHVASLFPNTDPRADTGRAVIRLTPDPLPPEAPFDRLSLTIPALLDCDHLLFVMRGPEKRALFEASVLGANDLPVARLLKARHQPVTCFA